MAQLSKLQRVIKVVDWLVYEGYATSRKELATKLGYKESSLSQILTGRVSLSDKFIKNLYIFCDKLNKDWLLTGKGSMLKESSSGTATILDKTEEGGKVIRYWREIEATGGGLESFNDIKSDFVPLTLPDFNDCTDAVNIVGESMEPTYKSGSIILLKEWTESFIDFGNPYLVITRNGNRMVKILRSVENNPSVVKCESINTNYDPFEIQKSDILRLYIVKGVISKINM